MKKFELYWKDLNIGSIVETNWDMRSSGDIVYKFDYLAEPSENELMSDFVKFSIQDSILLGEGVEDDDLYLSQAEEEKKFLDLIVDTKTDWLIAAKKRIQGNKKQDYKVEPYHKQFYCADYTLHQRKDYSFNIRTVSVRTKRTETGNGENLYGQFLADGATNIQQRGNEYYNIMPVWEWDKIPGITCRDYSDNLPAKIEWGEAGSTDFVGGVSDGKYGCSVYEMNYNAVNAKKAWFFFDKEIVCLGAGINSLAEENISTTLNQCWLNGKVSTNAGKIESEENIKSDNLSWVWHDRIGYYFLENTKAVLSTVNQKGSWKYINKGYSDAGVDRKSVV